MWQRLKQTDSLNVTEREQLLSLLGGGTLLLASLVGRSGRGALLVGSYLLYRGLSGHCFFYELLGVKGFNRADSLSASVTSAETPSQVRQTIEPEDIVDETAWESFPASDPPAWTSSRG